MYFENFPGLYYTLDNNKTGQLVQDIFLRINLSEEIKNNNVLYETYNIRDGDTPEIVADIFYNNPGLYWIVLMSNDILDPRFQWPLDWHRLEKYIDKKYPCNLYLQSNVAYNFNLGEIISGASGSARVIDKEGNRISVVQIEGFFSETETIIGEVTQYSATLVENDAFENTPEKIKQYEYSGNAVVVDAYTYRGEDEFLLALNTQTGSTGTRYGNRRWTKIVGGSGSDIVPITFREYEIRYNDQKREIKILQPQYVARLVQEFKNKIST